jgi:uncharacterized membrane protein
MRDKKLKEAILEQKKEVDSIEIKVDRMTRSLLDKVPGRFSYKDVARAFFGAFFVGINFIFAGRLITVATNITWHNILLIILVNIVLLTGGIYYIGYRRVENKSERPFLQFWFKRIVVFCIVSMIVSFFLIYLFAIYSEPQIHGFYDLVRVAVIISIPTSIGAAFGDLLKQY